MTIPLDDVRAKIKDLEERIFFSLEYDYAHRPIDTPRTEALRRQLPPLLALQAVLEIQDEEVTYEAGEEKSLEHEMIKNGYNLALKLVREAIAKELGVE